jgi:hypothetical protein
MGLLDKLQGRAIESAVERKARKQQLKAPVQGWEDDGLVPISEEHAKQLQDGHQKRIDDDVARGAVNASDGVRLSDEEVRAMAVNEYGKDAPIYRDGEQCLVEEDYLNRCGEPWVDDSLVPVSEEYAQQLQADHQKYIEYWVRYGWKFMGGQVIYGEAARRYVSVEYGEDAPISDDGETLFVPKNYPAKMEDAISLLNASPLRAEQWKAL